MRLAKVSFDAYFLLFPDHLCTAADGLNQIRDLLSAQPLHRV